MQQVHLTADLALQQLLPVVRERLADACSLRAMLGLRIPEHYDVRLGWYAFPNALAVVEPRPVPKMTVNVLPLLMDSGKVPFLQNLEFTWLKTYFDIARDFFGTYVGDQRILAHLKDPKGSLDRFESSLASQGMFERHRAQFAHRGRPYEWYTSHLVSLSSRAKETLDGAAVYWAEHIFPGLPLFEIDHELDHIDFIETSEEYKKFAATYRHACQIERRIFLGNETLRGEYASYCEKMLELMPRLSSQLEVRGMYFSHAPIGQWCEMNTIKDKIRDVYTSYVHSFRPAVMSFLIGKAYAEGAMDPATEHALLLATYLKTGDVKALRYTANGGANSTFVETTEEKYRKKELEFYQEMNQAMVQYGLEYQARAQARRSHVNVLLSRRMHRRLFPENNIQPSSKYIPPKESVGFRLY